MQAPFDRALRMVQTYLAQCAEDPGDPRTAELTELIRSCVECMAVDRRGHGQDSDARAEREALRHAVGYVDERQTYARLQDMTSGRA